MYPSDISDRPSGNAGVSGATGGGATSSRAVATGAATHGDACQEIPGEGAQRQGDVVLLEI